jgi:hypothetical protein
MLRRLRGLCCLLLLCVSCLPVWPDPEPTPAPRARSFELAELLVDVSDLPAGWQVSLNPSPTAVEMGQSEGLWIEFRLPGGSRSAHYIFRYDDEQTSAEQYRGSLSGEFFDAERITPWEMPTGLSYESPVADQFRFASADFRRFPEGHFTLHQAVGQYDEFISVFFCSILPDKAPDFMTLSDLERILQAIDQRMALHLSAVTSPGVLRQGLTRDGATGSGQWWEQRRIPVLGILEVEEVGRHRRPGFRLIIPLPAGAPGSLRPTHDLECHYATRGVLYVARSLIEAWS